MGGCQTSYPHCPKAEEEGWDIKCMVVGTQIVPCTLLSFCANSAFSQLYLLLAFLYRKLCVLDSWTYELSNQADRNITC